MANRKTKTYYAIPEDATPQARWILNIMNEYGLNMQTLSEKIHVSKQAVSFWVRNETKISFANICAIVLMVDNYANPELIYKMIHNPQQEQG